jgi:hypothetical protein
LCFGFFSCPLTIEWSLLWETYLCDSCAKMSLLFEERANSKDKVIVVAVLGSWRNKSVWEKDQKRLVKGHFSTLFQGRPVHQEDRVSRQMVSPSKRVCYRWCIKVENHTLESLGATKSVSAPLSGNEHHHQGWEDIERERERERETLHSRVSDCLWIFVIQKRRGNKNPRSDIEWKEKKELK